jgi:hypothetical protein
LDWAIAEAERHGAELLSCTRGGGHAPGLLGGTRISIEQTRNASSTSRSVIRLCKTMLPRRTQL